MSRGQQGQVFNQEQATNQTYNQNAQTGFNQAQQGVGTFENQLAKFSASNPYVQGGQYSTSQNQSLADTANAGANATAQALQSGAVHGGANPAQAVAASEEVAQNNQRTLSADEGQANTQRIGAQAGYNETALSGYQTAQSMQDQLAQQQAAAAQGAAGTEEQAAQTPSFMDMLGQGLISAGSSFAGGFGQAYGKQAGCWIAAELWGGWEDERVKLVRLWLWTDFNQSWYGALLCNAYGRWGQQVAEAIKTRKRLRTLFSWLFEKALREARRCESRDLEPVKDAMYGGVRGGGMTAQLGHEEVR